MSRAEETLEHLVRDLIRERRASRRNKMLMWGGAFLLFAAALVAERFAAGDLDSATEFTARVDINGPIADGESASAESIKKSLAKAFDDKRTKAVVLKINSPGGSPVQAGYVYDELKRQRALHSEVKVYAVITDLGASGAYYIASAADEIVADKASLVGSIGVTAASFGYVDLMNKLGVERRSYVSGEHKAFLDPFQPQSDEETQFWGSVLQTTHKQFINAVKAGRGERLKAQDHPELFSGLIWSGEQALELGLIDRLGDVDYVAREIVGVSKLVDFTAKDSPFDRFAKRMGASAAKELSMSLGLDGLKVEL
ncbi:TPA: signal peptide peptidase SppA [Pseudomonas aeruginosa]|uniref:Signal peptide peptidase SppA n=1 Tax=Pseudomonas aeruginosa TaxID=287 RepID=A0A241XRB4_PSEAI|nr:MULTISPECIES: signal peptide peptidase SppA [Pseudomonas]MBI6601036.1 signal peptide peptidase SppA [Pseudomonas sp. S4_EA_1b]MBI8852189.1 signal peptide peptidase SppA [Pseudomonas aeruginosa]OBY56987.1 peptidase S49 [Pseudomonas sp. AU12215]OTI62960.1 signal peptide peptidase SppA [Pseudomonas aeruginosa]HDU2624973.1 signal peptide peptidase SppA [Pseudomonas aeruginosa]